MIGVRVSFRANLNHFSQVYFKTPSAPVEMDLPVIGSLSASDSSSSATTTASSGILWQQSETNNNNKLKRKVKLEDDEDEAEIQPKLEHVDNQKSDECVCFSMLLFISFFKL
jgi:hypothetical protein